MIDYKTLFSGFPVIEEQFDLVAVDALRFQDNNSLFYVPIIRYMIRNHVEKKVEAGFTIRTAATCESYEEIASFIATLSKMGFFIVDLCAYGTIYNEDMTEVDEVNWNNVMKLMANDYKQEDTETKTPTYLH